MRDKKRIEWVDFLKGLGILLVVYGHVILGVHDAKIGFTGIDYHLQSSFIYTLHMPLFFFLSGLFAEKWAQRSISVAFKQKALTLLVPYFIWGIIQGTIMTILSSVTNNSISWNNILLLPIKPFAQFWFLYDLFFIFIFYYLLKRVTNNNFILVIAIVLAILSPILHIWELWRISYHFIFFLLGTLFIRGKLYDKIKPVYIFPIFILFIIINIEYFILKSNSLINNINSIIVALIGIGFVISLSKIFKSNFIDYLGRLSLPIYLMHIMATAGSRIILIKIMHIDNIAINVIVGLLLGVSLPIIAYNILKKLKLNRYLFMEK